MNEVKANYAGRAIKSLKMKMSKYLYENQTTEWYKTLPDITYSYNHTYHRSIKMTPAEARDMSDQNLWVRLYLTPDKPRTKRKPKVKGFRFKQGDQVKLSF